jgi:hypothetical protein
VRAWIAFHSPDPSAIEALTGENTSAMPWREASGS